MIYLSGPMTGYPEFNYPAFRKAAKVLRDYGFKVFDPSECFGGDTTLTKEVYMKTDIKAVLEADLVVTLEGWEDSSGAKLEVEVAQACGIPVTSYDRFITSTEEYSKRG